jgi:hypothetical protein
MNDPSSDSIPADAFALEDLVVGKSWAFGNAQTGQLLASNIVFESGGKLVGYSNPNEADWRISDGALELLTEDEGRVSTRFDTVSRVDGQWVLEGRLRLVDAGPSHVLVGVGDVPRQRYRTALIMPIHAPDFKYGINFLFQSIGSDYDVVMVFSTDAERRDFATMHQASPALRYRSIVAADYFTASTFETMTANHNWVTTKKYLALQLLQPHYDYFYCVDSEAFILSAQGWEAAARSILSKGTWYGGTAPAASDSDIVRHSALSMAPVADFGRLADITGNWTLFPWWWDLPVYASAHLPGFFEWIGWTPARSSVARYGFDAFDHMTYQFYTVLYEGFVFHRPEFVSHCLEFARADVVKRVHREVGPMRWANALAFAQDPEFFRSEGYLAIYHIDRKAFPQYTD